MFCIYDLYDLSAVYIAIRHDPEYKNNLIILKEILDLLENREKSSEVNQLRTALSGIEGIDKNKYYFVDTQNVYTYFPSFLKNDEVYNVLIGATKALMVIVMENKKQQIIDLADALHNLPIYIVEYDFSIPKSFWKNEVASYRKKWFAMG